MQKLSQLIHHLIQQLFTQHIYFPMCFLGYMSKWSHRNLKEKNKHQKLFPESSLSPNFLQCSSCPVELILATSSQFLGPGMLLLTFQPVNISFNSQFKDTFPTSPACQLIHILRLIYAHKKWITKHITMW